MRFFSIFQIASDFRGLRMNESIRAASAWWKLNQNLKKQILKIGWTRTEHETILDDFSTQN